MKAVALVSGGKDSCFNMLQCVQHGHEIVALANLKPSQDSQQDELDSFMFQTVGHEAIEKIAEAMQLPLYRQDTSGQAKSAELEYVATSEDEVEDLFELLARVKREMPEVQAVASGAILSNYQRLRVENVCVRLGLVSLAYLWQREQHQLLREMLFNGMDAVLVKVASAGLNTKHLSQSLADLHSYLDTVNIKYGVNVCGEGGEYETLTRDCPLFAKKIVIESSEPIVMADDAFAPTAYLKLRGLALCDKSEETRRRHHAICEQKAEPFRVPLPPVDQQAATAAGQDHTAAAAALVDWAEAFPAVNGDAVVVRSCGGYVCVEGLRQPQAGPVGDEVGAVFSRLKEGLARHGAELSDIIRVVMFVADMADFAGINAAYVTNFGANPPSRVCVQAPLEDGARLQLHCIAARTAAGSRRTLHVQSISRWAPANIGPYSQAVTASVQGLTLTHAAGQIAMDPGTLTVPYAEPLEQATIALTHVKSILEATGTDLARAVCVTCYLTDLGYLAAAQQAARFMHLSAPVVYVVVPVLPRGALVEWEVLSDAAPDLDLWTFKEDASGVTIASNSECGYHIVQSRAQGSGAAATDSLWRGLDAGLASVGASWDNVGSIRLFASGRHTDNLRSSLSAWSNSSAGPALGIVPVVAMPGGTTLHAVAIVSTARQ